MDFVFARHGVDAMLERGEIDVMVLSHWHLDHFWGIEFDAQAQPAAEALRARDLARRRSRAPARDGADIRVEDTSGRSVAHLPQRRAA